MKKSIENIRKGEITYNDLIEENKEELVKALDELEKIYKDSVKTKDHLKYKIAAENLKSCLDKHGEEFNQEEKSIAKDYIKALEKISEMNEDHIEWLSDMNFFSEMFILQTALTLKKIKLCDDLKNKFIKELKEELEVYSTDEFNLIEE